MQAFLIFERDSTTRNIQNLIKHCHMNAISSSLKNRGGSFNGNERAVAKMIFYQNSVLFCYLKTKTSPLVKHRSQGQFGESSTKKWQVKWRPHFI